MNGIKHINMDYKKAYKAVLETATQWIKDGCTDKERICLESVFPELRESEDERVRKWLISLVQNTDTNHNNSELSENCKLALAYLEKQKESLHIQETCKENADSFTDACKDVIVAIEKYLDWLTGYPDYAPKGKYSIRDMLYCLSLLEKQKDPENVSATTMAPSCWEVEQKEQKPPIAGNDFGWIDELKHDLEHPEEFDQKVDDVLKQRKWIRALEWSEEDENKLHQVMEILLADKIIALRENPRCKALYRAYDELLDWLKSLCPQSKQEEDISKQVEQIRAEIEQRRDFFYERYIKKGKGCVEESRYDECVEILSFIDSLPNCTVKVDGQERVKDDVYDSLTDDWKPSEEQMNALRNAVNKLAKTDVADSVRLSIMYDNLKKLGVKEEPEYYQHFDPDC